MINNDTKTCMGVIKDQQIQILVNQVDLISKNVLLQLAILGKIAEDPTEDELYEEAKDNEVVIDRLEIKIREEVAFTIFKFSPMAEDLRRIISYQDMTTNLERIGDMALNNIRYLREIDLSSDSMHQFKLLVAQMIKDVTLMVRNAILSYSSMELETAYDVIRADDNVDDLYFVLKKLLTDNFADRVLSTEEINTLIKLENIAHNLERCGDSATNIAESTIYLVNGNDIRHGQK